MELADRLPFCPRCAYSFAGLPEAHQCPECGLAYNADSRMWVAAQNDRLKGRSTLLFIAIVNLVVGLMIVPRGFFISGPVFRFIFIIGGLFNLIAGTLALRRWWRFAEQRPSFFAVLPDGLWCLRGFDRARSIPWERIKSATSDWVPVDQSSGRVIMIHVFKGRRISVPAGFMSSVQVHEAIARIRVRVEELAN